MTATPVLTEVIDVEALPAGGYTASIEAGPSERIAIAEQYGLLEVRSLIAHMTVRREDASPIQVDGRVEAEVVQSCVISLEPVVQQIAEDISVRYILAADHGTAARPGAEVHLDINAEPPDVLPDAQLDLGALVLEHFALGIDPYPRAPGAELEGTAEEADQSRDSPFAVLAKLTNSK